MFAHAPRLVQQRPAAPAVHERTPSHVPPLVPRSRAPSFHQSSVPLPFPTRKTQPSTPPTSLPATRPTPEPWVDALKDDVEAEFSLSLVDDIKAAKDAALAAATSPAERAAILREYDESMADIRAQARAEFQRRVEAERERRLQANYQGKDALIAEQHNIMESIMRENMLREASQSSTAGPSLQAPLQVPSQSQPGFAQPSQPIPIPVQRNRSRKGSVPTRSVPNTSFASSPSSSPRLYPTGRRDSITQHPSTRPLPPPVASPATSVSSTSSLSEPSSSYGSYSADVDRRYEDHRVAVQRLEEEVKRKEVAARRSAEEARRREVAAARHEEDARRKNEEATRRMREARQREQQVIALEARARKEMELAQKETVAARARTLSQSQSAAAPLIARVFSKEVWQQKPRPATGATIAPRREAKVRA